MPMKPIHTNLFATDPSSNRGFARAGVSLVELMIVIAIIAILIGAAYPVISQTQRESRVDNTSRELGRVIKQQRLRAQNFNRSMFFKVDVDNQKVEIAALDLAKATTNRSCAVLDRDMDTEHVAFDLADGLHNDASLTNRDGSAWVNGWVCIRPDGQIINPSGLQPYTGESGVLRFYVERSDGVGDIRAINVPFNGVVRHSILPR
ncbi:MAG: hypothetical protein AUK47_11205 [Deltaproteobacteria bacterium CG2_30_63_29]|nr:MAG: hypothetical protein AUK47_11205 [Deltaproteobacteria bacterium CG2_30_63_29]